VFFVKRSNWFACVERALFRRRTRRELKRLKADFAKLREALGQAEEMKLAIAQWKLKHSSTEQCRRDHEFMSTGVGRHLGGKSEGVS
jgi:hypothetical protein